MLGYVYVENNCPTLSGAYVCIFYLQKSLGTLYLKVSTVKFILLFLAPPTKTQDYTTLMGAPP